MVNPLERLSHILRAQADPAYFLHSDYFLPELTAFPVVESVFTEFYRGGYKELDMVAGMGGGKSFCGSLFTAMDAFDLLIREDPAKDYGLASHSPIFQLCVAKSDDQAADTIFSEVKARISSSPFFAEFRPRIKEFSITFDRHPDLEIIAGGAASAGSLVGRNVKTATFDEISSYDETKSQRGAWQVYSRLRKSTNRFGYFGHVLAISSPWHPYDIIMTLVEKAKTTPKHLSKAFTTWEMNPKKAFNSPEMQAELEKDPITFWRDYGIQPHSSIDAYYPDLEIIVLNENRINVLEPLEDKFMKLELLNKQFTYILSADPAIVNDAFGLALLHREGNLVIADGLWRFLPTKEKALNPVEMKHLLLSICKNVPIRYFITDQWNYPEAMEEISRLGIQIMFKPLRKEEHDQVKNAWFEKKLELCNYPRVKDEFGQLLVLDSRRIGIVRGGKIDVVDALTRGYWAITHLLTSIEIPNVVEVI